MTNVQTAGKSIGRIKEIALDITEPLKMEALKMPFQQAVTELPPILERSGNLTLLVGANGTGKTFLLVNVWCLSSIANHAIFNNNETYLRPAAQFIYDHCFSHQNITGKIEGQFTSGVLVSLEFKKGKIFKSEVLGIDSSFTSTPPVFLSSSMRLFESISYYLKTRKRIIERVPQPFTNKPEELALLLTELVKDFKLYDIAHLEATIKRCPIIFSKKLNKVLRNFQDFNTKQDYKTFDVDLEQCDFYVTQGKSKKKLYLTTFDKGHQAIFNMFVTLNILN